MQKLPKAERLCSQKQIATLMNEGIALFHFPFKVFFSIYPPAIVNVPCCQMMVNVPKRNFKKAVTRNLLKRRVRESFRKNKTDFFTILQDQNKTAAVFFHYVSPEILSYADIEKNIIQILEKFGKMVADGVVVSAAGVN